MRLPVELEVLVEEEELEGVMNLSIFPLVELTWVNTSFLFICSARRYIRSSTCI